jgi:hypothetical protein
MLINQCLNHFLRGAVSIIILLSIIAFCIGQCKMKTLILLQQKLVGTISTEIPVVIINWNSLHFFKLFVLQLKQFHVPIIVLDNKSDYWPLLNYYKELKETLGHGISIWYLEKNYGHQVYLELKDQLPDIFILSDPDIRFNPDMPHNFREVFLEISNQYQAYKVGTALDISDSHKFIQCDNYVEGTNITDWERQFWVNNVPHPLHELYDAAIDTTTCLVNNFYRQQGRCIRVAKEFTAKHMPWYQDYIQMHVPADELANWKKYNKSSTLLNSCFKTD